MRQRAEVHFSFLLALLLLLPGSATAPCPAGQEKRIAKDTAAVRERPLTSARLLGRVPRDSTVEVNLCAGGWCHITFRDLSGFAPESMLVATGVPNTPSRTPPPAPRPPPPTRSCCRVCTTGKACGNSCISRSYTCRQPPGCACNGDPLST